MSDRDDPSAVRWLVGVELARFRERSGQTTIEAGKVIGCSPGKIGHMESGRNQQQPGDVRDLLRFYKADQADIDRLSSLAGSAGNHTWWAPWNDVVPDWLRTFVGLEGMASHSMIYAPLVFPALLMTEEYALGMTEGNLGVRPDHNDRVVSLRMARQSRLSADPPLRLTVLLEQAVLDRPIGDDKIMRGQFEHVLRLMERETVDVRILPITVGAHDALVGPFTVLEFEKAQSIGYVELVNGAVYVQDHNHVAGYTRIIDRLLGAALSAEQSRDLLRTRLKSPNAD